MDSLREALTAAGRRRFRSFLVITGIGAGIFIFLVIGSMATYFSSLSEHVRKMFTGRLFLCEKVTFWTGGGLISEEKLTLLRGVEDIRDYIPLLIGRLDREEFLSLGMPSVIVGVPPQCFPAYLQGALLEQGRIPRPGEADCVVIGHDVAMQHNLKEGEKMDIRDYAFTVCGILEKTGSLEDRQVLMHLERAQALLMRPHLLTSVIITPKKGVADTALAAELQRLIPWARVIRPVDLEKEVESSIVLWEVLTVICGLLSGLTSFLSIAVIMLMTISERRREIGIKKALGAENRHIYGDLMTEVLILCFFGWCLGMLMSAVFIGYYHHMLSMKGFTLFRVTFSLVALSLAWTLSVGALAAFFPLRQAMRIEPISALRQV